MHSFPFIFIPLDIPTPYSQHSHPDSPYSHPYSPHSHPYFPHSNPNSPHSHLYSPHSHPDSPHSHPIPRIPTPIPCIPTLILHIPTLIPRIPILNPRIPLIPFPDSTFRRLQIALTLPIFHGFLNVSEYPALKSKVASLTPNCVSRGDVYFFLGIKLVIELVTSD